MNKQEILAVFEKYGGIITDSHIVYSSGKHGSAYVDKGVMRNAIYSRMDFISSISRLMAKQFSELDPLPEVIVSPVIESFVIALWAANHLAEITGQEISTAFVHNQGSSFAVKDGHLFVNKRFALIDEVVTIGGSLRRGVEAIKAINGELIAVAAICNRGLLTKAQLGEIPTISSLFNIPMASWPEAECPLCPQGVPINTKVGKGREFLAGWAEKVRGA